MYAILAPIIGGLITVMNGINSVLAAGIGNYLSVLVIHIVGLAAVCLVLPFRKGEGRCGRPPFYYYAGGFVGVGTVFCCNIAFSRLGASLAVALALLGQMLASLAVDSTGFLGRKRYPLSPRSIPGILIALAGIWIMAGRWEGRLGFMALAFLSGILPLASFILNSQLSLEIGIFKSARANYLVGLATTLVLLAVVRPPLEESYVALKATRAFFVLGGGILGVVMVAASNFIIPKIPALTSTLLMFAGQALTGVVIEAIAQGSFPATKLAGTVVVLAGLGLNVLMGGKRETAS